jgi:hypothetical protein
MYDLQELLEAIRFEAKSLGVDWEVVYKLLLYRQLERIVQCLGDLTEPDSQ